MNRERDLLPWILGGLSTAAVALAIAGVMNHHRDTASEPRISTIATTAVAAAQAPVPPPSAPASSAAQMAESAPAAAASSPISSSEARPGQIWTCMTKGIKTFSNNPCGENSARIEVGPINTMNPTMPVRYSSAYPAPPQYAAARDTGAQAYADEDADQGGYESGADSYAIVQGVAVLPRRRFEHHPHRTPYHHSSATAPRKF